MTTVSLLFDLAAERAVLGAVLSDNALLGAVLDHVTDADFFGQSCAETFRAMLHHEANGAPFDYVTLRATLGSAHEEQLLEIATAAVPGEEHAIQHAKIVHELAVRRRMQAIGRQLVGRAESADTVADLSEWAEAEVWAASQTRETRGARSARDLVVGRFEAIRKQAASGAQMLGQSTGFRELDRLLRGMNDGDLIVVAGRPGMGKTAFANGVLEHVCQQGGGAHLFNLEMDADSVITRTISSDARVMADAIRTAKLSQHDWTALGASAERIASWNYWIDDTPGVTIAQLRSKARRVMSHHRKPGQPWAIGVDYLQLMRAGQRTDSREQEVALMARSLKLLARELRCPVIALSQLNRKCEERTDKRPLLSDLRESGAIEQDADTILFLYRDEVYSKSGDNTAEIICAKQRNGSTGTVKVGWFGAFTRFDPLADDSGYNPAEWQAAQ